MLISDMIEKLTELQERHGDIDVIMVDESEPSFTHYTDEGEPPVLVVE